MLKGKAKIRCHEKFSHGNEKEEGGGPGGEEEKVEEKEEKVETRWWRCN